MKQKTNNELTTKNESGKNESIELETRKLYDLGVLAIDPGTNTSGVVTYRKDGTISGACPDMLNADVLEFVQSLAHEFVIAVETMENTYGRSIDMQTILTLEFIGEIKERCRAHNGFMVRCPRSKVTHAICRSYKAKDKDVRAELISRFGEPGTKKNPGVTYGISSHAWSALAVAIYAVEQLAIWAPGNLPESLSRLA